MSSDLLRLNNSGNGLIADVTEGLVSRQSNIAEDLYNQKRRAEATAAAKQQAAFEKGVNDNRDLLASQSKLDKMIVDNTTDIYPYTKRPDTKGAEVRTDAVDKSMGDNPLAGSMAAIKQKFSEALSDPRYATTSHAQLLDAVKKDHLAAVGPDGTSLLDKANKYKYEKDNGLFRFFSDKGDESVTALPGYEAYKAAEKAKKPYDTSLAESIALNVGATALMTGAAVLTGGAAVGAGALALRLAGSAAIAYPEMAVFDKAANAVVSNRQDVNNPSGGDMLAELAIGTAGLLLAHKVVGVGTSAALSKAMKFEKTAAGAAAIAGYTGKATEALTAFRTGAAAKEATRLAEVATETEKAAMRVKTVEDFKAAADLEVLTPEVDHVKSLITSSRNAKAGVDPINAHVMGLTDGEFSVAKPSVSPIT